MKLKPLAITAEEMDLIHDAVWTIEKALKMKKNKDDEDKEDVKKLEALRRKMINIIPSSGNS